MGISLEKLFEEYITNNKSVKEISDTYGLTNAQVKGQLRRNGIRKTPLKLGNEIYDNRDWLYKEYITKKKGYSVIANEQGVPYHTILSRIHHFGWEIRSHKDIDKGEARRGKKASKETVEKIKATRIKNRVETECCFCGTVIEKRMSSFVRQNNHFCDYKCRRSFQKANRKEQKDITDSAEYKEWRKSVYIRDGYRCKYPDCNSQTRDIQAHHIYKKVLFPEFAFDVNNGITLCRSCHQKTFNREHEFIDLFVRVVQK